MSLKEAYNIFIERNTEISIGFSTFCKLRPQNVLHLGATPPNQCKCHICENFLLKLSSLKISYDSKLFWEKALCDTTMNSLCWKGGCDSCCNGQKVEFPSDMQLGENVTFKIWEKMKINVYSVQSKKSAMENCRKCYLKVFLNFLDT